MSGFSSESTVLNLTTISADSSISIYAPYELTSNDTVLKQFVVNNQNKLFNKLPTPLISDNISVTNCVSKDSTSMTMTIVLNSYYDNGSVSTSPKNFDITINGLGYNFTRWYICTK